MLAWTRPPSATAVATHVTCEICAIGRTNNMRVIVTYNLPYKSRPQFSQYLDCATPGTTQRMSTCPRRLRSCPGILRNTASPASGTPCTAKMYPALPVAAINLRAERMHHVIANPRPFPMPPWNKQSVFPLPSRLPSGVIAAYFTAAVLPLTT